MLPASLNRISGDKLEGLLAAAYAIDLPTEEHLATIHEAWARLEIDGDRCVAFCWHPDASGQPVVEHLRSTPPELLETFGQVMQNTTPAVVARMAQSRADCGFMSQHFQRTRGLRAARNQGYPDFFGLLSPTQTGFVVSVGTPMPTTAKQPYASAAGRGLAEHLAASWRLRKRLEAPDAFEENAEAVLAPDGRLQDAVGEARRPDLRERLRAHVMRREVAMRERDGSLWPALLDGRYTIVDRFERSGSRYVVAYRNSANTSRVLRLTPLEKQLALGVSAGVPQKVLAIELGLSPSRISSALRHALRKVGIANAIELSLLAAGGEVVAVNDEVLGPSILAAYRLNDTAGAGLLSLTPAEREVTADLLRGLSNREIAAKRNRRVRTIANQVASVLAKVGAGSRRTLVTALAGRP